jgi:hypothetical protein
MKLIPDLLSGFQKWVTGHYGGVGPLWNERRDGTQSRSRGCRTNDHSQNFFQHWPDKGDGDKPGLTGTLWGNRLGQEALRRDQQEQMERSHRENRAMGRMARLVTDVACTALGEKKKLR